MITNLNIYRFFAGIVFIAIVIFQIIDISQNCDGNYIYPLDDTYIHLSIANNFSNHGIWGVTSHEFSSSSSSLLYTLILSISMLIFGNNQLLPLLINIVTSYVIIIVIFNLLKSDYYITSNKTNINKKGFIWTGFLLFIITAIIALSAPIVILTLSGMEHTIQILVNLLFISALVKYLSDSRKSDFRNLILLAPLVTGARFEGIFLIFIAIIFLLTKKEFKKTFYIFIAAVLPLAVYGLISQSNGWMPLPNSILLKSTKPETMDLIGILLYPLQWIPKLMKEHHLLTIFISAAGLLFVNHQYRRSYFEFKNIWLVITLLLIIIHLTFAKTGWVYRYEAYIVVIGLVAIALNIADLIKFGERKLRIAVLALVALMIISCGIRTFNSITDVSTMSRNIYEQQFQMSRFLGQYYGNYTVTLGDIGACTYFTDIKLLDLVSLGSIEPLKLRIAKKFNAGEIEKLAKTKNAKIAILYKDAFLDYIPPSWIEAGDWKISNNIGCYMDRVTFYAVNLEEAVRLKINLIEFNKQLPSSVEVNIRP